MPIQKPTQATDYEHGGPFRWLDYGDKLLGGEGADLLLGGDDNDYLNGGNAPSGQHDTVAGQAGDDIIIDSKSEIDEAFTFDKLLV
jgi:hypothetical protein